ncbi:MAG: SDR family NAD(P)-dependent oxidoreductase [Sphingomonadales bacterium]|nr:SDR family NAD(P)-dependent oxidoreductase [Sphingomonadales bacterium]
MQGGLDGRTALVTGAAGGIGTELTRALLKAGASVTASDVSVKSLFALNEKMTAEGLGARLLCHAFDVSENAACVAAVAATEKQFGGLDILVNNAGLGMSAIRDDHLVNLVGIEEIEPEVWDRFMRINLSGAWYLTRAAVPDMKRKGWGRIVTVTTSMFTMLRGKFHPYGPSKAALEAMSAGHAQEFTGTGITVNVVVPGGPTDTPMVPASSGLKREDLIKPVQMTYPLLWLCSTAADAVTGKRYVAAHWAERASPEVARAASEAPIGWPGLAAAPVWPGGKPKA